MTMIRKQLGRAPLGLLALALSLVPLVSGKALAGGGQDWPFFCKIDSAHGEGFRVVDDRNSPTGYSIQMLYRGRVDSVMPASISTSQDKKHWVIYGRERLGLLRERQLLALIAKEDLDSDSADVRTTLVGADPTFEPQPIDCATRRE